MNIFKRKSKVNIEDIFQKIFNYKNIGINAFNKFEINLLQTPSIENISFLISILKSLSNYQISFFFDNLKSIINETERVDTKIKIQLFSESLLSHYIDYIVEKNKDTYIETEVFLVLFSIIYKYNMHNDFKIKILEIYDQYSNESLTPFYTQIKFNELKEELDYA